MTGKVIQSPIEARPMYAKSGTPPDSTSPLTIVLKKMPHRFLYMGGRENSPLWYSPTTEEIQESVLQAKLAGLPLWSSTESLEHMAGRDFFCSKELYSSEYTNFVLDAPDVLSKYKAAFKHQRIYKVEWL